MNKYRHIDICTLIYVFKLHAWTLLPLVIRRMNLVASYGPCLIHLKGMPKRYKTIVQLTVEIHTRNWTRRADFIVDRLSLTMSTPFDYSFKVIDHKEACDLRSSSRGENYHRDRNTKSVSLWLANFCMNNNDYYMTRILSYCCCLIAINYLQHILMKLNISRPCCIACQE